MVLFLLFLLFNISLTQFLPTHKGEFVTKIGDYTFEYHDESGLLLIIIRLDCYIVDVPQGSPLATILDNPVTRTDFLPKIKTMIENGGSQTPTTISAVNTRYHDPLVRAMCFITEIYNLDVSSLLNT